MKSSASEPGLRLLILKDGHLPRKVASSKSNVLSTGDLKSFGAVLSFLVSMKPAILSMAYCAMN